MLGLIHAKQDRQHLALMELMAQWRRDIKKTKYMHNMLLFFSSSVKNQEAYARR